jgi:hypothetical protein
MKFDPAQSNFVPDFDLFHQLILMKIDLISKFKP